MANPDGTPIWYELVTDEPDAAQDFYGAVLGWTYQTMPGGLERDYRVASAAGEGVGGVMRTPDHAKGMPSTWRVYFGTRDVDATVDRARSLGARVEIEPTDIPGVGRFSFLADPQGAHFYLMRGASDADSTAFAPMKPGHCSWNELVTSDQRAALDFYGALFGWKKTGSMPMGGMGEYTFIGAGIGAGGDDMIGAMMDAPDKGAAPFWNFAFTVPDIDAAKAAVENGGGTITHGPVALPGDQGGWLIQTTDPQGAKVMFTGKRKG